MQKRRVAITNLARRDTAMILGALVLIYIVTNTPALSGLGISVSVFWIGIASWLGLDVLVFTRRTTRSNVKFGVRRLLSILAVLMGCFHVVFQVASGLFEKQFGKSPYSMTPIGIATNLVYVTATLTGMEMARVYLVRLWGQKWLWPSIILTSALLTSMNVSWLRLMAMGNVFEITQYLGRFVVPSLAEHLLASYLAFYGGLAPAMLYRGVLVAFQWFCPVLPNPSFMTSLLIGTLVPLFSLLLVQQIVAYEAKVEKRPRTRENPWSWIVTSLSCVGIVWFAAGVFPVYPSVIATGSMLPMIKPGDVILVKKVDGNQVQVGDVIQYRLLESRVDVTHRVIGIVEEAEGDKAYQTQGDANPSPDSELVKPAQVRGRIVRVIPKVGWPTLLLKGKTGETDLKKEF